LRFYRTPLTNLSLPTSRGLSENAGELGSAPSLTINLDALKSP